MHIADEINGKPMLTIRGCGLPDRALAYLATPYTHYKDGIEIAFREASRIAANLLLAGVEVYSPIAHCHPLAIYGDINALDRDFWLTYQEQFMLRSDVLIVAEMDGWKESVGIRHEIEFFDRAKRPRFQLNPATMSMRRLVTDEPSNTRSGRLDPSGIANSISRSGSQ